jgi:aspartate/methionine/tyrosine aminotransferase
MLKMIPEYEELWALERVSQKYCSRHGADPFNISHWDPSAATIDLLASCLRIPKAPSLFQYLYSYDLMVHRQLLERLGSVDPDRRCVVVPSGTNAIMFAAWWLKCLGVDRLAVLCPAYFSIFHASEIVNLAFTKIYMHRNQISGLWELPTDAIRSFIGQSPLRTAIWITNPIYSAGVYLSIEGLQCIKEALAAGVSLVADECLCINGYELGRALSGSRFVGLYSPHKAICMNALKFAAITFDHQFEDFFESCIDVISGPLSAAAFCAIHHFCDDNFLEMQEVFLHHTVKAKEIVATAVRRYPDSIEFDARTAGHFITCYLRDLPGALAHNISFLENLAENTAALVIPGPRNHFSEDLGFTFRINLARACPQFDGAVHRTMSFLVNELEKAGTRS